MVERTVRAYNTTTGELINSTTSVSGTFYLESPYSTKHHVVCHDDEADPAYNDLIYGKIEPVEITPINWFTISINKEGNMMGYITPADDSIVEYGYDKTIYFEPKTSNAVDFIEHNENSMKENTIVTSYLDNPLSEYTFTNVKDDYYLNVHFAPTYDIEVNIIGIGTGEVTPSGIIEIIEGRNQLFEFYPSEDSALNNIKITNISGSTIVPGPMYDYTLTDVHSDTEIEVYYSLAMTVTLSGTYYNDATGTYYPSEPHGVLSGDNLTIEFYPDEYVFVEQIIVNGDIIFWPGDTYVLENVSENIFVEVVFTLLNITEEGSSISKDELLGGSKRLSIHDTTDVTYGSPSSLEKDTILGGSKNEV
jgi:hypothetical protein